MTFLDEKGEINFYKAMFDYYFEENETLKRSLIIFETLKQHLGNRQTKHSLKNGKKTFN